MDTLSRQRNKSVKMRRVQHGFTLIEAMIAGTLFMIGFLGNLSMQSYQNQMIKNSGERTIASKIALSLAERMRNNVTGVLTTDVYLHSKSNPVYKHEGGMTTPTLCPCDTPIKQAQQDIAYWQTELALLPAIDDIKPLGTIELLHSTPTYQIYQISVSWPSVFRYENKGKTSVETVTVRVGFNV